MTARIVFSLDFELRWGVQDKLGDDLSAYRRNLEGVREAVPAMLELFTAERIRATWAFVGALACETWDEYEERAPAWPRYRDPALAWNPGVRSKDPRGELYFAPDLVERIRATPGQDLGSHTFSHVYMGEPGFVRRDAIADTAAVQALFRDKWHAAPKSFVFPRNQVAFEDVLADSGIAVWRANPSPFFWSATSASQQLALVRLLRFADGLGPLGTRTYPGSSSIHPASHFVRFGLPQRLWRAHLRRLSGEARRLGDDRVLHLWWHPHNLGGDVTGGIARLSELVETLKDSAPSDVAFSSMADLAAS